MEGAMCCPLSTDDYGDRHKFYLSAQIRARKAHYCIECNGVIKAGDVHERVKAAWHESYDGKPVILRTCKLCHEIREHFSCGNGHIFEQLWEDLENNFFPDMKAGGPCMEGLSPEAKQKLVEARMEWYFDQGEVDDERWEDWAAKRPQP